MSLAAGQTLAFYEIVAPLGAGGMGEVYRARDTRLGRDVALKVLPEALREDPERRTRFLREARAVAQLSHPNIAQILDVGEADGRDYIAFELVEGETMERRLAGRGLALQELVDWALPLADALASAHERGIVHRDLKAANVMLTARGHPKVLDFGLAKVLQEDADGRAKTTTLTLQGAIFGTPSAMSPEQALGKTLDARSDVFSFGSLLYEMACGRPAFDGETVMEVMDAVIHRDPPPLARARPELPPDFVAIVEKAQRKDPRERYQTMSDLAADLRHFKRRTDSALVPPVRSPRRSAPLVVGGVLGLGVLSVALWWLLGHGASESGDPPAAVLPYVAVMGFENLSDAADEAALGRMLASLVTTDLAERGGLRVVSTAKVRTCLEEVKPGAAARFESTAAAPAARAAGATVMLVGQILRQGNGVLLTAELVDVASGETRGSLRQEAASPEEVFALAGGLADSVRARLDVEQAAAGFDLSRALTDSPEAYREFSAGELALHQRDFMVARSFFQRAIERDPTFAMAWFRLGATSEWLNSEDTTAAFEKALEHSDRLTARWRSICEAAAARSRDDYDTAFDVLSPLVDAGIDIPEAYNELGEILTHSSRYRDPSRSRRCFARALELDPTYEIVLYHLVNQTIQADDLDGAKALVERMTRAGKASFGKLAILLGERRYADAVAEARRQLAADGATDWEEYLVAARKHGDMDARDRAAEAWWTAQPGERNSHEWEAAAAAFLRGRFTSIPEHLDRSCALSNSDAFHRSVSNLLRAQLSYGMGDLEAAAAAGRTVVDADPYEFEGWFWLGLAQLKSGRSAEAARTLEEARAALGRSRNAEGPGILDSLEAVLASAAGDGPRAMEILGRAPTRPSELRQRELENLARAYVAEEAGDFAAALTAWRALIDPPYVRHIMSLDLDVWPLHEIGRLEQDHGDPAAARAALERFLAAWGQADRELASIADARERLARLSGR